MSTAGPPRKIELMALEDIRAAPRNAKRHNIAGIGASIGRLGLIDLPVIDERTGCLVAGHGRVEALSRAANEGGQPPEGVVVRGGKWFVPVVRGWASADDREADAAGVALNQWTIDSGFDDAALLDQLKALDEDLLAISGFDEEALDDIRRTLAGDDGPGPGDAGVDVLPEAWGVIIEVDDEGSQVALLEEMMGRGLRVRAMVQ